MAIRVKIEIDDAGKISVGVDVADTDAGEGAPETGGMPGGAGGMMASPGAPAEGQEDAGMQQVGSIDEALAKAKELLSNPQAGAQPGVPDKNAMWNKVQRDRAMAAQPGGPLMGQPGA